MDNKLIDNNYNIDSLYYMKDLLYLQTSKKYWNWLKKVMN